MYRWESSSSWIKAEVFKLDCVEVENTERKIRIFLFKFKMHYLALNLFLDEVILALVIEDDVDFLGAVAADVRA